MDAKNFVYVPPWVKVSSLLILVSVLAVSLYTTYRYIDVPDRTDWILVSLTVAQIAISGLVIVLIVFFSEKDLNIKTLIKRTDRFLEIELRDWFRRMKPHKLLFDQSQLSVEVEHLKQSINGIYHLNAPNLKQRIGINCNVKRIEVVYYLPITLFESEQQLREVLSISLVGAEVSGFKIQISKTMEEFDGQRYWLLYMRQIVNDDFLYDAKSRLFWLNDIVQMSRSVMIEVRRTANTPPTQNPIKV